MEEETLETPTPETPQTPVESVKTVKSFSLPLVALVVAVALVVGGGLGYYLGNKTNVQTQTQPQTQDQIQTQETTEVSTPSASPETQPEPDPTDKWKIYTNSSGVEFSLKYPKYVNLRSSSDWSESTETIDFHIDVDRVDTIGEAPLGYGMDIALKDIESLQKGLYGERIDQSLLESQQVINVDGVNAKTFIVLGRFEICSVALERKAIMYKDGYRIMITLKAPRKIVSQEAPQYFKTDSLNCGEMSIWNFEAEHNQFYKDLLNGTNPSQTASEWFDTFNQILSTFEFLE